MTKETVFLMFGTFFSGLAIKICWDWLKGRRAPDEARNMDPRKLADIQVTFGDLKAHCENEQHHCQDLLLREINDIKGRLEAGDAHFEILDGMLDDLIISTGKAEKLEPVIKDLTEAIRKMNKV